MSGGVAWLRGIRRKHPLAADASLAVLLFGATCLLGVIYSGADSVPFDAGAFVLTGLVTLPLAARRIAPFSVLLLSSAAFAGYLALGHKPDLGFWGPALALYSVAAFRPPLVTLIGAFVTAAAMFYSGMESPEGTVAVALAQAILVPAVVWILGGVSWQLRERNQQLAEATEELRREQQRHAEQAVTEERLRIARELHDVVAHHMSVISMQAGLAGYVFDSDPATARASVDTIGSTSREALEEMRRLLNLLRFPTAAADSQEPGPAPDLGDLDAMADRLRSMGVDVELSVSGDLASLPSGQQLAVYRVIQEALTNVLKHAGRCRATVTVTRKQGVLHAVITNAAPPEPPPARPGGGHGVTGMRERARLYGGMITAGTGADGGFTVELTMPAP